MEGKVIGSLCVAEGAIEDEWLYKKEPVYAPFFNKDYFYFADKDCNKEKDIVRNFWGMITTSVKKAKYVVVDCGKTGFNSKNKKLEDKILIDKKWIRDCDRYYTRRSETDYYKPLYGMRVCSTGFMDQLKGMG